MSPHRPKDQKQLVSAADQAKVFNGVRQAHQLEVAEDYVELIDDLIEAKGEARVVDLAERLGISQSTVNKTISRLQREGLVTTEPYRSIFLTPDGKALADTSRVRHEIVYNFLLAIGVSEDTAVQDAEGVEHHVSKETLAAFQKIISDRS
ncbi:MAG: manganese-binding transcriptional regulator MntR [Gammaproteobacteria bacterium]|nr:manganese-binding transcriptional regulator MntR [Gammaproteobacteria bacterium]